MKNTFIFNAQKYFSGLISRSFATKLFLFFVVCAVSLFVGCQKDFSTGTPTQLSKSNANDTRNKVSLEEAKSTYQRVRTEASAVGGTSVPSDFLPQWNEVGSYEFADTVGNFLSVPSARFVGGGYKKLLFFQNNGQITFLVATILADAAYIRRKNGVCTMEDFDGKIYYQNTQGIATGGFVLKNGDIVQLLVPNNRPRPELEGDEPEMLNTFTVTAARLPGNGGLSFSLFVASMYGNYPTFTGGGFTGSGFGTGGSGGGGSGGGGYNSNAGPVLSATEPICSTSFVFYSNSAPGAISPQKSALFKNFSIEFRTTTAGLVRVQIVDATLLFDNSITPETAARYFNDQIKKAETEANRLELFTATQLRKLFLNTYNDPTQRISGIEFMNYYTETWRSANYSVPTTCP